MKAQSKIDISLADKSTIRIPKSDYLALEEEIKKVKYPTYAISQAQRLQDKINTFKNEKVIKKLRKDLENLNSYRKVRGDGNCFFRALAFSYISNIKSSGFDSCFQLINQVSLACCQPQSIPKNFQKFYDNKFLLFVLKHYWQAVYEKCLKQASNIHKKALLKLFDENPYLDFIIILYFRAVCLKALYKYSDQFRDFITGGQQQSIRTYSQQTQGITINLCSKIFNISIYVYEVRKQQIIPYQYQASKIRRDIPIVYLLFYENHYDIIQNNENIQAEQSGLRKKQTYYEEVNENLKKGVCQECKAEGYINQVSGLCIKCHEVSLAGLNNFSEEAVRRAQCQQCQCFRDDVSVSFGLCKKCIEIQNQVQQRRHEMKKKKCNQCNSWNEVDPEIGLCLQCKNTQKSFMKTMEVHKMQISKKLQQFDKYLEAQRQDGSKKPTTLDVEKQDVKEKCQHYHKVGQIKKNKLDGQICQQCLKEKALQASKFSKSPNKGQNAPIIHFNNKQVKNCAKCNNKILQNNQSNVCEHCRRKDTSYQDATCKKCGKLKLSINHIDCQKNKL